MYLYETYSKVWGGKYLFDAIPLKITCNKGDALLQLLFHFALEYAIKKIQVNHMGLKLKEKLQSLT